MKMASDETEKNEKLDATSKSQAADVSDPISHKLKALYQSVEDETIPDRFLDLLEQLDAAEQKSKGGQS